MNCPVCGHPDHFHRENRPTQRTALDDPVPCFAVTARELLGHGPEAWRYTYCECTEVRPL